MMIIVDLVYPLLCTWVVDFSICIVQNFQSFCKSSTYQSVIYHLHVSLRRDIENRS